MTCTITTEYLSVLLGSVGAGVCFSFGLYLGYGFAKSIKERHGIK